MNPPPVTATQLRQAARHPPVPCCVVLDDGRSLMIEQWLRVLPEKRLTGFGRLDGTPVIAKLFVAARGSARHWQREYAGNRLLMAAHAPTPSLLAAGCLAEGGRFLVTEFLAAARRPEAAASEDRRQVLAACGRLHALGLVQTDAHPDNFLIHEGAVYFIDGDGVRATRSARAQLDNLALLLAQWPDESVPLMDAGGVQAYREGYPERNIDPARLAERVAQVRTRRLADYLDKCLRDSSLFRVERSWRRFVAAARPESEFLAPLIAAPDAWMQAGRSLKQGRTATLALVETGGRQVVIKRYNIKHAGHALSRAWRPSRAWHAWVEAHRLRFLGIATPRPLALIERRWGPLRGCAWLITEYCSGPSLSEHWAGRASPEPHDLHAVGALFRKLAAARISHGDLKATNILWHEGCPVLIDLDATQQHTQASRYQRAWEKDCARLLRNWTAADDLRRALERELFAG